MAAPLNSALLSSDGLAHILTDMGVPVGAPLAIAVSGGADSLCLALLAAPRYPVTCLIVDHGLRAESGAEAEAVAAMLAARGIAHEILHWQGDKPDGNIQMAARDARYGLMADWCETRGIRWLLTGHHLDDQAETVILRLARGSGVYGLAAMAPVASVPDGRSSPQIVRPFLDIEKARLVATLRAMDGTWIEDPSNRSDAFDRVRVRNFLEKPPLEGLTARRLAETARRMRRTRDALDHYERQWFERAVRLHDEGHAILDHSQLVGVPEETVLRGLADLIRLVGGGAYVPRLEKLERLLDALQAADFAGQTLLGVQFGPNSAGRVLVCRELRAMAPRQPLAAHACWDKRFDISAHGDIAGLEIGALGEDGWIQLMTRMPGARDCGLPHSVRIGLPALYRGDRLQAVPHLGYSDQPDLVISLTPKWLTLPKK